jgi:hypothetical protein
MSRRGQRLVVHRARLNVLHPLSCLPIDPDCASTAFANDQDPHHGFNLNKFDRVIPSLLCADLDGMVELGQC